jgi:hypothetical protein
MPEVSVEERHNARTGVSGCVFVVAHPRREPRHYPEKDRHLVTCRLVVVEEGVPSGGVLLHVVVTTETMHTAQLRPRNKSGAAAR